MSDRLAELRRQRALVQQHLDWLDREIAAEAAKSAASSAPPAVSASAAALAPAPATSPLPSPDTGEVAPDVDRLLAEYRVAPASLHTDVRKGCLIYFAAAFALLAGVVAILYFALTHR